MQVHSRNAVRPTMSGHQQQQATAHNHGGRVVRPQENANNQPPPPPQKCPRCDSANTKFCYYNNYSLSQPRYYCKACRRYWTQGGTLRNIPVGGGCRKGKRPKLSPSTSHHEISSGTQIPSLANPSSSSATPAYSSQSLTGFHHQALRAANPLMMGGGGTPNYYYNSSGGGGGFYSSLPPHQGGVAGGGQFGGNVALLQGMNFQSSRPQPQPQVSTQQQQMIPQQAPPQWTQGFINSTAANNSSMMAPNTTSFWSGANVGDQSNSNMSQQAAGTSSFSYDQWKWNNYNNNQGLDHSR